MYTLKGTATLSGGSAISETFKLRTSSLSQNERSVEELGIVYKNIYVTPEKG